MALINKFLSTIRKLDYDLENYRKSRKKSRCCEIALQQVRLLLYKECDLRGRKVLFDSSTIDRVPADKNDKPNFKHTEKVPCILEVSDGHKYIYKGQAADASLLGEMIFGAVAMNCKSVSLKIHITNDPKRLMCTKIFHLPVSRRINRTDRKVDDANSSEDFRGGSGPLNVSLLKEEGVSLSFSLDRGDSGFYGEQSPYSSVNSTYDYFSMFDTWDGYQHEECSFQTPSGRKLSICSNGSWQRRTFQSIATRFDLGQSSSSLKVPTATTVSSSDSQIYSSSSASGTTDSLTSSISVSPRKSKLGLALLITVAESADTDIVRRCVEHSPQLQALVCRLRVATLAAGTGTAFISTLHRASEDAARWLSDLLYGPRLQPMWLGLVTSEPRAATKMADTLISDICSVLAIGDTKDTNFFTSTLLTYVLTFHLGWVTTVSPYDAIELHKIPLQQGQLYRPYNALWAQLTDLCGSIGFPPRASRTIIVGSKNIPFVNKLLSVLTYFIRSGNVRKNDYLYQDCLFDEAIVKVKEGMEKTGVLHRSKNSLKVSSVNMSGASSVSTLVAGDSTLKKSTTLADLNSKLSIPDFPVDGGSGSNLNNKLRRQPTMTIPLKDCSDSSPNLSSSEDDADKKVVFVLGDDEKLVGLKNKSNGGKSVKKSPKVHNEPVNLESAKGEDVCDKETSDGSESTTLCCKQTLQHSKPIKHSGFKFEFDKYPQIVTNYMKSKNLEILDRHYIGKPGNLKLDNFQFDPTVVPAIQDERCEACTKCQLMESMLQTPTNASEMEYMNDMPRQIEPQYAKETIVEERESREISPKTFVRKRIENTIVVNIKETPKKSIPVVVLDARLRDARVLKDKIELKQVIEFPLPDLSPTPQPCARAGYDCSLLGSLTDHYVPDLVLQGTSAEPNSWEADLRRDLDLTSYLNKSLGSPVQTIAIIGDTNTWDVRLLGRECGSGGLSPLVGSMLDALPAMRLAKVPAQQCLLFLESKLREFCVMSKTLADMLMSTDFCDIATLTKSLDIDINDVPLLLAIATTHTPQVATRYGLSYR